MNAGVGQPFRPVNNCRQPLRDMLGLEAGTLRLPLVEASEEERAVIREALDRHNLLAAV